jgi:hypothetical protein
MHTHIFESTPFAIASPAWAVMMLMLTLPHETPSENLICRAQPQPFFIRVRQLGNLDCTSCPALALSLMYQTHCAHDDKDQLMLVTVSSAQLVAWSCTSNFRQLPDAVKTPNTYLRDKHSP